MKTTKEVMMEGSLAAVAYVLENTVGKEFETLVDMVRDTVTDCIDTDLFFNTDTNNDICLNQVRSGEVDVIEVLALIGIETINNYMKDMVN